MKVPEYERDRQLEGLPDMRQHIAVDAADFLSGTRTAFLRDASGALAVASRAAFDIQAQRNRIADKTRALDAVNQFEARRQDRLFGADGAFNQRGAAVFTQANSKPLTDNVVDDLNQDFADIADGLGNEEQKRLFAEHAGTAISQTRGQLLQHEAEQYRVYRRGVGVAAIDTHQKAIALNYNNPALIGLSIAALRSAGADLGELEGYGADYGVAQAQRQVSDTLSGAIQSALAQNDHAAATRILQDFSPQMDSNDMLKGFQAIGKAQDAQAAYRLVQGVLAQVSPRLQTSDQDRALNLLAESESGGRHFADDGQVLSSGKGAKGKYQLLQATGPEAAKLAGLPWDASLFNRAKSGDAAGDKEAEDYNAALGTAYFNHQLRQFHGDLSLAYAAYNAGPEAARAAVQKSVTDGGHWLSYLPQETQEYVTKTMKAFDAGEGRFKKPTLEEGIAAIDARLGPDASPSLRKLAREEFSYQYALHDKAVQQRGEAAAAEAYRQLLQNGGNVAALPAQVRDDLQNYAPERADSVLNFAGKIARGEAAKTDWALYYKLKTDPALLRNTNLMALRDRLNDTEFKQLSGEQQGAVFGGHSADGRTAKDILDNLMVQAGIDPTPKDSDRAGAATVGKIWSAFSHRLSEAEQQQGKRLSSAEMEKLAGQLFSRVGVKGLLFDGEKPAVLVDWRKDRVQVPEKDRDEIIDAWREARPGQPIGEDDIFYAYLKHKGLL